MRRHDVLLALHRLVAPRTYLEIGVSDGRSLTLSSVPSIGIDPAYRIKTRLDRNVRLVKATSDDFFARPDPLAPLRPRRSVREVLGQLTGTRPATPPVTLDLVFIDGMHLFEFALRDFINVERFSTWTTVIVFDDILPRDIDEAARDRHTKFWAGDVFKVIDTLRRYRPDLVVLPVDASPTGTLVVLGADPTSRVLPDAYDEIVRIGATPDPQVVPAAILERRGAVDPQRLVDATFWSSLVEARRLETDRSTAYPAIRDAARALVPGAAAASPIDEIGSGTKAEAAPEGAASMLSR